MRKSPSVAQQGALFIAARPAGRSARCKLCHHILPCLFSRSGVLVQELRLHNGQLLWIESFPGTCEIFAHTAHDLISDGLLLVQLLLDKLILQFQLVLGMTFALAFSIVFSIERRSAPGERTQFFC